MTHIAYYTSNNKTLCGVDLEDGIIYHSFINPLTPQKQYCDNCCHIYNFYHHVADRTLLRQGIPMERIADVKRSMCFHVD